MGDGGLAPFSQTVGESLLMIRASQQGMV